MSPLGFRGNHFDKPRRFLKGAWPKYLYGKYAIGCWQSVNPAASERQNLTLSKAYLLKLLYSNNIVRCFAALDSSDLLQHELLTWFVRYFILELKPIFIKFCTMDTDSWIVLLDHGFNFLTLDIAQCTISKI